ncbi:hypothetical protein GOBAR_AA05010 [Gossypium barbadense]|uniref:Heparan-alpha-glucosaminide N-acetyltransferase catalytic domain-containing protein n=1 Tax=Gossypium barbadense TaxID=3634 RepID=A0A2P5YJ04_GOSBA|nr:hypothetical protein GOBAR_AA05010 [Gossypium barbadense]
MVWNPPENSFGLLHCGRDRDSHHQAQTNSFGTWLLIHFHCLPLAMVIRVCLAGFLGFDSFQILTVRLGGFVAFVIYMTTTYSLHVPDWSFVVSTDSETTQYTVKCGMRGHLGPACNAVGYVDREVWGINHLYIYPVWKRLKACTHSSSSSGQIREDAPSWCRAPFEPEGLLSSILAILSGTIGIHYGHVLIHFKGHPERLKQWVSMALGLLIVAIILRFTDAIPINEQLYSFSYVCFTTGAAGIVFSAFYILDTILAPGMDRHECNADICAWGTRHPSSICKWMVL